MCAWPPTQMSLWLVASGGPVCRHLPLRATALGVTLLER